MPLRPLSCLGAAAVAAALLASSATPAQALTPTVGLGAATSYAILAGSTVTSTGSSVISGDVGISGPTPTPPTGFPPALVNNGVIHDRDQSAGDAQGGLTAAYVSAQDRVPPDSTAGVQALGGRILTPGIVKAASEMSLDGTVTLDAGGDPAAVFLFQAGSTLVTGASSTVALVNGAQPCNVFWQVGSSATLGVSTTFVGTIMAQESISLTNAATVQGRLLARTGAVTLINNQVTRPTCAAATTPPSTTAPSTGPTPGPTTGPSATAAPSSNPTRNSRPDRDGPSTATRAADGGGDSGSGDSGSGTDGETDSGTGGGIDGGSGNGVVVPVGRPDTGVSPAAATSGPDQAWLWGGLALLAGAAVYPAAGVLRRPRHRARHT